MKIALVHDWLTGMRGGEYVLDAIAEMFPKADLHTLLYVPGTVSPVLTTLKKKTSWLQRVPNAEKRYRHFLPLMPRMIEGFDLSGYDLIISSSHCVAKGVKKDPGAVHVSYVHAPMRYMWDRFDDYFGPGKASLPVRLAAKSLRSYLQNWDREVSAPERVDHLVANSQFIADQIKKAYGRDSEVIYPFVDLDRFRVPRQSGRNYLMVTAFAPYKRVDLAIRAFNELKLPLIIVGSGQDQKKLKKIAGPTIDFLGGVSNRVIADLYAKCRAFVFPGKEDFGITPLEAMAAGAPVIAFGEGGAAETVTDQTGILFKEQTVDSLKEAILKIENEEVQVSSEVCQARAREFSKQHFQKRLLETIRRQWENHGKNVGDLNQVVQSGWAESANL